jgi:hypothetical protein
VIVLFPRVWPGGNRPALEVLVLTPGPGYPGPRVVTPGLLAGASPGIHRPSRRRWGATYPPEQPEAH